MTKIEALKRIFDDGCVDVILEPDDHEYAFSCESNHRCSYCPVEVECDVIAFGIDTKSMKKFKKKHPEYMI